METEAPIQSDVAKKRVVAPLTVERRKFTPHVNLDHTATVEHGITLDDVLNPDFWALVSTNFAQYDQVRVRTDDGSWYAVLLVTACDRNSAHMTPLIVKQLDESVTDLSRQPALPSTHEVKWRGPHSRWCVIRKADGVVLKQQMGRDEAFAWASDYLRTVSKKAA